MSKFGSLLHPSGSASFGQLVEMRSQSLILPAGPIMLFHGEHFGPNRGWGALHIWEEHRKEMVRRGFEAFEDVPGFVATIIRTGASVVFEGPGPKSMRIAVVRNTSGTAILESRNRRDGHIWSVVTAFSGNKAHGTRVGTVR